MVVSMQYTPPEMQRQQSERSKKTQEEIKRGVIVNSIVKDSINCNQNDMLRDYIIPAGVSNPEDLKPQEKKIDSTNKSLKRLCLGTLGVLGGIAITTKIANKVLQKELKKPSWETLPDIGRSMNLNNEAHFVTYMTVQNPQTKTVVGASAFFVFAATALVLKNFVDGFKDIWVKKQAAKADYKLQDDLIDVETKIFKGKNDIVRTMMHDTAHEMQGIINNKNNIETKTSFKGGMDSSQTKPKTDKNKKNEATLIAAATVAGSIALCWYSFKNIQKTGKLIQDNYDNMHKKMGDILAKSPDEILEKNKDTLKQIFSVMNFKSDEVEEKLKKAKIPEKEIKEIVDNVKEREKQKRFTHAPKEVGGYVGKLQYSSYIDDARGHFYNWIMNIDSKPLGILAMAISAVTGIGYTGEKAVEAIKEVEVKKINNETELNLHKNLINVELRNFKQKKDSYISPLVQEFKNQAPNKSKEQLDPMAQNILYEIKNGPPFVYA